MNPLEEALVRLSTEQKTRISAAWARFQEGALGREEFVRVATNIVLAGNVRGYALGAATVRSLIEQAVGAAEVIAVAPAARHLDETRIATALTTVLDSDLDTLMQLSRLADNEPKQAATDGSADVLARSSRVRGWTRTLDSDACELCRWWWREGRVWQPDHPMPRHTGCTCTQTPVVRTTDNYQTTQQKVGAAESARRRERSRA